ncbi:transposase zinc-binding domain-containing protein [Cystobacter fuscus]|uniref:transposase zinc-binding domain-containing protein n=1 Tax=Cystobacter fuscus TaxID=43 RepID=UPI0037C0F0A5
MTGKDELLVAFSCKGRGVCPCCNAKWAQMTAAYLVERVLPHVPYRQWTVLCAPGAVGSPPASCIWEASSLHEPGPRGGCPCGTGAHCGRPGGRPSRCCAGKRPRRSSLWA